MTDLAFSSATELAARIRDKRLSPVALVRAYLDRIDRLDGTLHAYITVTRDEALAEAEACEQAVGRVNAAAVRRGMHPARVAFLALDPKGNVGAACTAQTNFQYAIGRAGKVELVKARELGPEVR